MFKVKFHLMRYPIVVVKEASKRLSGRDEDDVELLALALKLEIPIWSNDRDFRHAEIEVYTTARLLKKLGI